MTRDQYLTLAQAAYDGGFTVDLDGNPVTNGYAVAVPGYELRGYLKPGTPTLSGIAGWIEGYVVDNGAALREPARYLGAWRDGADIVLDVVEIFASRNCAIAAAANRGEQAIYDLGIGQEIRINLEHCASGADAHSGDLVRNLTTGKVAVAYVSTQSGRLVTAGGRWERWDTEVVTCS